MAVAAPPAWLYLHFPHLQADQLSVQDESAAVAILDGNKRVLQLCEQAAGAGIKIGMPFTTALQLHPELKLKPDNLTYQQHLLIQLADTCYTKCARIALAFEQGLLLEVASMWRLFGGRANYWQQLQQQLAIHQLRFCAAAAQTPTAAYTLAQAGLQLPLATPEEIHQELLQLPLSALPLPLDQQQKLRDVGIKRLAQMVSIPMADWKKRFSGSVATWLAQLNGEQLTSHTWFEPPVRFIRDWHCLHEIQHANGLLFPLQRILKELSLYLRRRQLATVAIEVILHHREHSASEVQLRLAQPEHQASEFIQLARLKLDHFILPEPVIALQVRATELVPQQQAPADLFTASNIQALSPGQLLNRLQSRLGCNAVQHLRLSPDPRPEHAYHCGSKAPSKQQDHITSEALRPCWLLREPLPLPRSPWELKTAPERIACGWWDNQPIQRDYFVAEDHQGQLCWVFRTPGNQWFIHGWFG